MDERVDRSDPRIAPDPVSRASPVPSRSRTGFWILIGLIADRSGRWRLVSLDPAPDPTDAKKRPGGTQRARRPAASRLCHHRQGRHSHRPEPARHRDIARHGNSADSDQRPAPGDRLPGRPVGQKGRFPGADRPSALSVAALEQAQGTLAHDQGLLAQAQADLKRYQTLGRQDSIAQQQLDDQRFLVQQYTGTVQTDQGAVDAAKVNLAYCHIVSPIDGQVGLRLVDQGNYVQTSSTTGLVVITQIQPISVIFAVPEDNLPDIIQRLRAGATLSVEA